MIELKSPCILSWQLKRLNIQKQHWIYFRHKIQSAWLGNNLFCKTYSKIISDILIFVLMKRLNLCVNVICVYLCYRMKHKMEINFHIWKDYRQLDRAAPTNRGFQWGNTKFSSSAKLSSVYSIQFCELFHYKYILVEQINF